ncbi:hypothetical protein EMPS_05191 [Entomortierella parvispora]|uniref:Uncharacterized protein n=1 Tax=Entomortierella parvispora TaxID=205924 RepID=A0A9P3LW82_9FUNG|nr:hypothetical protein EMPS_05191 [Entomortierella parvispora]
MQLGIGRDGTPAPTLEASVYEEFIADAAKGPIRIFTMFNPVLSIQGVPGQVSTDLSCINFYPAGTDLTHCNMFLQTDSSFPMIRDYFNKLRNPTGVVSPSPTETAPTVTVMPSPTVAPTTPTTPTEPTPAVPSPAPVTVTSDPSPPVITETLLIPTSTP